MSKQARTRAVTLAVIAVALAVIVGRKFGWDWPRPGVSELISPTAATEPEPRETIYRMLDAAREGDVDAYIACYSGQMRSMLDRNRLEQTSHGFARYLTERNQQIKGVAISEPVVLGENEVQVRVEYVYEDRNEAQQVYLEELAAGWKISRVDAAERVETLVPYGTPVY